MPGNGVQGSGSLGRRIDVIRTIVILLLLSCAAQGQILDNSECSVFSDDPFFNSRFIDNNRICMIHGEISDKRLKDIIRETEKEINYSFDPQGRLVKKEEFLKLPGDMMDTAIVVYLYDDQDRLVCMRKNDGYGFFSYYYEYNEEGFITSEKYCRNPDMTAETPLGTEVPGKEFVIASETYQYERINDTLVKRKTFNNYGKQYQETFMYWNNLGYKVKEETRLLITNKRITVEYTYDDKGRPLSRKESSNIMKPTSVEYRYVYDEVGNVEKEQYFRNGVLTTEREAVYYKDSMLLKALIVFDVNTQFMNIIRYDYKYD